MTSKDGSVNLGDLKGIDKITAKVNLKSGLVVREWSLSKGQNEFELPTNAIFLEGEEVTIPCPFKQKCQLWRVLTNSGVYSENHNDKISCDDSKVTISGLKRGQYALELVESDIRV